MKQFFKIERGAEARDKVSSSRPLIFENDRTKYSNFITIEDFNSIRSYFPRWSWDKSNGSATDFQTRCAFAAIDKEKGYGLGAFSHYVWNDLVEYVYRLLKASDKEW